MATVTTTALSPTTSAAQSAEFFIGTYPCMTVTCAGLTGSETGTVQFKSPQDGAWINLTQDGVAVEFTSSIALLDVWNTAGTYRVNKTETASPVGVFVEKF
jgi:hypothetical protein